MSYNGVSFSYNTRRTGQLKVSISTTTFLRKVTVLKIKIYLEIVTKLEQQIQNEENSIENLKKDEKKCLKVIIKLTQLKFLYNFNYVFLDY